MSGYRSVWKGHFKVSLVAVPVKAYTATSDHNVSFHQLHASCGERINYTKTCATHGPVQAEDIARGYEWSKGQWVTVEDAELDALKVESTKAVEVVRFVPEQEIDPLYFGPSYYLEPDGPVAREGYATVREAMRGRVAIGKVALRGREDIVAVRVVGDVLVLSALWYADEVRSSAGLEKAGEPGSAEAVALARQLVEGLAGPWEPTAFEDTYQAAVFDLVRQKAEGQAPTAAKPAGAPLRVFSLVEALKKSLAERGEPEPVTFASPARAGVELVGEIGEAKARLKQQRRRRAAP